LKRVYMYCLMGMECYRHI